MKTYTNIVFDLDGTLTDPVLGITNSVIYALEKYGIPVPDRSELLKFIGGRPSSTRFRSSTVFPAMKRRSPLSITANTTGKKASSKTASFRGSKTC